MRKSPAKTPAEKAAQSADRKAARRAAAEEAAMSARNVLLPLAAAIYTATTENALAKMRCGIGGSGPVFRRRGRSIFYLREDLDRWLESFEPLRQTESTKASAGQQRAHTASAA